MDQRQMMDGRMQSYRMENTDMYQNQNRVDFQETTRTYDDYRFNRNQMTGSRGTPTLTWSATGP